MRISGYEGKQGEEVSLSCEQGVGVVQKGRRWEWSSLGKSVTVGTTPESNVTTDDLTMV